MSRSFGFAVGVTVLVLSGCGARQGSIVPSAAAPAPTDSIPTPTTVGGFLDFNTDSICVAAGHTVTLTLINTSGETARFSWWSSLTGPASYQVDLNPAHPQLVLVQGPTTTVPPIEPEEVLPGGSASLVLVAPSVVGQYELEVSSTSPPATLSVEVAANCSLVIPATE